MVHILSLRKLGQTACDALLLEDEVVSCAIYCAGILVALGPLAL